MSAIRSIGLAFGVTFAVFAPCLAYGCSYADCASIESGDLGDSYCRVDGDFKFPIREVKREQAFAFVPGHNADLNGIVIELHADPSVCRRNEDLVGKVTMKLKHLPGGGFMLELDNKSGMVPLHGDSTTAGRIQWLEGHDDKNDYDYAVYLYDEPRGADRIVKHYRLEAFDKNCLTHLPKIGSIVRNSPSLECKAVPGVSRQTGSGDGYEPKK